MTDRVKQLEAAIEKAIKRVDEMEIGTAYRTLVDALAPAESGPTCPKCGDTLVQHTNGVFTCYSNANDGYSQPDSAQRPKMPEPREGYHAGEWRKLKHGERWFLENGLLSCFHYDVNVLCDHPVWIAVPDAPVSEPVPTNKPELGECPLCHVRGWIDSSPAWGERKICRACKGSFTPSPVEVPVIRNCNECGNYTCEDFGNGGTTDTCEEWVVPTPRSRQLLAEHSAVKVPVVEYALSPNYAFKIVDGITVEAIQLSTGEAFELSMVLSGKHASLSAEEYESYRKTADHCVVVNKMIEPAIEPLGDTEFGRAEMHDKLNEVIARVNALEGGGKC